MDDNSISRREYIASLGSSTTIVIAGCQTGGDTTTTGMADSLSIQTIGAAPDAFTEITDAYNQTTENEVDFEISELGYEELNTNLLAAISAGSGGPDIATPEARQTPSFIGTGGLTDFSDRIEDIDQQPFVDWRWATLSDNQGQGRYGLPIDVAPCGTFYNKSIYEEYGFSPEDMTTYQDFINAAQEVDSDINWMSIEGGALNWRWEMLVRQQKGQIYDEEGQLMINTSETRTAADLIRQLYQSGAAANISSFTDSWVTGLNEDRIATVTSGVWMSALLQSSLNEGQHGNWGIQRPPALTEGGNRATNHGGSNIVVPAHTDNSVANRAWDFIQFAFSEKEQAMTYAREAGVIPANESVYNNDYWEEPQEFFGGDTMELFLELAPEIPRLRITSEHREVYTRMADFLESYCVEGEYESAEAMAQDAEQTIADEVDIEVA